jgi:hypothetical protein
MVTGFLLLAGLARSVPGWCSDPDEGWKAVGIRAGLSATSRTEFFHQYEVYAVYGLPWSLRGDSGWGVALQANVALGALHAAGQTGVIGSFGPSVILDKGGKGFMFELGGDLNGLSTDKFGTVDLDGNVLFTGHVGAGYRLASGPGIGYRFQHMSNGGTTHKRNTGLDLHMLALSWNFP